jgi:hypothetical protein
MQDVDKLRKVVLERLVCGEDETALRTQLVTKLNPADVDQLLEGVKGEIEQGRGNVEFERSIRKIRKQRLVGQRYLAWKIIAGLFVASGVLSVLIALTSSGQVGGSFGGLLIGGIILALVEWREHSRMSLSTPDASAPPQE